MSNAPKDDPRSAEATVECVFGCAEPCSHVTCASVDAAKPRPRAETPKAVQINVPALAPKTRGDHVHSCPECYEHVPCNEVCSTEHDLTLDDGTRRGAYVVCDACKIRKQKTQIACRTWEPSWRDEYMQYSYDRGVFEGAAILDGLVGMGIAIGQRRPTATAPSEPLSVVDRIIFHVAGHYGSAHDWTPFEWEGSRRFVASLIDEEVQRRESAPDENLTEVAHAAGNLLDALGWFPDTKHPYVIVRIARLRGALDRAGHCASGGEDGSVSTSTATGARSEVGSDATSEAEREASSSSRDVARDGEGARVRRGGDRALDRGDDSRPLPVTDSSSQGDEAHDVPRARSLCLRWGLGPNHEDTLLDLLGEVRTDERGACAKVLEDFLERHKSAEDLKLWPVRECLQSIRKRGE